MKCEAVSCPDPATVDVTYPIGGGWTRRLLCDEHARVYRPFRDVIFVRLDKEVSEETAEAGELCGSFGCVLPKGHNMGNLDIPEHHTTWGSARFIDAGVVAANLDLQQYLGLHGTTLSDDLRYLIVNLDRAVTHAGPRVIGGTFTGPLRSHPGDDNT